jgi:hypothetical protein
VYPGESRAATPAKQASKYLVPADATVELWKNWLLSTGKPQISFYF